MEKVKPLETVWYRIKLWLTIKISHLYSLKYFDRSVRRNKRTICRRSLRQVFKVQCKRVAYGQKYIYDVDASSEIIAKKIFQGDPCFIGRFGLSELRNISYYINSDKVNLHFSPTLVTLLCVNAGFFPATDAKMARYCSEMVDMASDMDILCCWNRDEEEQYVRLFCPTVELLSFGVTCPVWLKNSWTRALKGKKVLVISPFAKLIEEQYQAREHIFADPQILPQFELITIEAVQSIADNKKNIPFVDWFEALDSMNSQIDSIDFDIALIGAGAYAMHLGAHCKRIGKQSIVLGGMLQVLFGIYGSRWEEKLKSANMLNEYWVRPGKEYQPAGFEEIEGGCYW